MALGYINALHRPLLCSQAFTEYYLGQLCERMQEPRSIELERNKGKKLGQMEETPIGIDGWACYQCALPILRFSSLSENITWNILQKGCRKHEANSTCWRIRSMCSMYHAQPLSQDFGEYFPTQLCERSKTFGINTVHHGGQRSHK